MDVIELSSDSEDESEEDDCVMVPSTEDEEDEDAEAEDVNDGGAHINDDFNCPDDKGRVLVNVGHPADDPDVFLSPQMAKSIKPHQIGGVRFLYDNLVESVPRFNTSQGFGCVLAHSMGLGKTIQVIAFVDIFLRHTSAKKVLCIVPINTLQNWMAEFNMWAPAKEKPKPPTPPPPPPKISSSEKRRDRSKKDKDKEAKTKEAKGLFKGPMLAPMAGPGMAHMGGMNSMGSMPCGPMGQMGGHMNQMGGPNMMTGPGMNHMGHGGSPMGQMGPSNSSPWGFGHGMSHMGGHGMGPGMGYGGSNMGMYGMGQMGGGGYSNMGMPPWLNPAMGQQQYGGMNMAVNPYIPPNAGGPMGLEGMGHPGMASSSMTPPASMSQQSSMSGMTSADSSTSESMTMPPSGSSMTSSGDSTLGPSSANSNPGNSMTLMNPMGSSMNAGNPMGTPPPSSSMHGYGSGMGMGNAAIDDDPMGMQSSSQQGMMGPPNSLGGSSINPMASLSSMDPGSAGLGNTNPMAGGPGNQMNMSQNMRYNNPMNMGPGYPMGNRFGNAMNPMGGNSGNMMMNSMGSSVNPMNGSGTMDSSLGSHLGSGYGGNSMNPMSSMMINDNMMAGDPFGGMSPMNALSNMNPMDPPTSNSNMSPASMPSSNSSENLPKDLPPFSSHPSSAPNAPGNALPPTPGLESQKPSTPGPVSDKDSSSKGEIRVTDIKMETKTATSEIKAEVKEEKSGGENADSVKKEEVVEKKEKKLWDDCIEREDGDTQEVRYRSFGVFLLNDYCKTTVQRAKIIGEWDAKGGVLLMGYEMYRLLSSRRAYTPKPKKKKKKVETSKDIKQEVIDVDEEDKNKNLMTDIHSALVNPGPDLVICDEGHRIKNNHASISQTLKQIRTKRRVVLTGYPLQNNLMEYWCMVDFVRPNFLGNKTEFSNMFERPIMNGQCQDSTAEDRKIMKHRAYVLHNLLEGFVQRRSHVVLQRALPYKYEYVMMIRMSPIQRKLYRRYMDSLEESSAFAQANNNPLKAFSVGCKIWNHPDILHKSVVLKKPVSEENDLDIEGAEGSTTTTTKSSKSRAKLKRSDSCSSLASTTSMSSMVSTSTLASNMSCTNLSAMNIDVPTPVSAINTDSNSVDFAVPKHSSPQVQSPGDASMSSNSAAGGEVGAGNGVKSADVSSSGATGTGTGTEQSSAGVGTGTTTETGIGTGPMDNDRSLAVDKKDEDTLWVGDAFDGYEPGVLEHGPKVVLLNTIIEEALNIGDKILVFSQSLSTLDTIEEFFSKKKVPRPDMDETWSKNKSYFRLDGSTSSTERERLITEFNRPANNTAWMFLLSTRAGCLGINMIGANRVVVLDASWNPCHDCQAVCRVFRFGQNKECHVYRLVTENTLERNIYDRQITKQGMSDRVVDEMNPDNHFSKRQLENLLKNEDKDFPYLDFSNCEEQFDDPVMVNLLKKQGQWITKEPFTHESLLIDRKEMRMSRKEKMQAKEGYARDKRMNITYSRPSYSAYYSGTPGTQMYIRRGPIARPIASVRPMISTPRPAIQVVKPGVTVHQVITTTDILLPGTNTTTSSGETSSGKIASGQKILVIKTPKGVYIRTNDGKMFAVRSKVGGEDAPVASSSSATVVGGTMTTTTSTTTNASSGLLSFH